MIHFRHSSNSPNLPPCHLSAVPTRLVVDCPSLQEFVPAQLPEAAYGAARKADAIVLEPKGVAK